MSDTTWTSLAPEQEQKAGALEIIRPSKLAEEGRTGVVAEGVLEKTEPNKFNPSKNDYFIRGNDNKLYILNETDSIKRQLGQPGAVGMFVRVEYNGKKTTKNKKTYHDFACFARKAV